MLTPLWRWAKLLRWFRGYRRLRLTVAVTGVGGGVGQSIIKALRMSTLECRIVAADANSLAAGLYRADVAYVLPPANSPTYVEQVIQMCHAEGVDALFPGSDPELPALARGKPTIEAETGARVIISSERVIEIGNDKWATAQFLAEHGLPHAASVVPEPGETLERFLAEHPFPLVLKPRHGSASRGVFVVSSRAELEALLPQVPEPVLQELVGNPEEEYTCGLFADADGTLLGVITARRELLTGTTYRAWVADFPDVRREVERIGRVLCPFGPCNVQLRRTSQGPIAFEINPRCSGTTAIRAYHGWNEPEAALRRFLLEEPVKLSFRPGMALRYWNEVYLEMSEAEQLRMYRRAEKLQSQILDYF